MPALNYFCHESAYIDEPVQIGSGTKIWHFAHIMANAALVMTDSGGIQAETTILNVPCITLRETTECPITLSEGTNQLVTLTTDNILKAYSQLRKINFNISGKLPSLWDGLAARRIAEAIQRCHTLAEV